MKNEIADRLEKYANEIRDSYDPEDNLRDVILDSLWYLIELSNNPVRLKIVPGILIWPLLSSIWICRYDDFDYYLSVSR